MATTVSKTSIANLALANLRHEGTVENVDTENSEEAILARLWYDPARRQALTDYDWTFARKRLTLATHANAAPTNEWAYRYQVPANMLAPRYIVNPLDKDDDAIPYDMEVADNNTLSIVTDQKTACLVYTYDLVDATLFAPHFVTALSFLLAWYMAGPLTARDAIKTEMITSYQLMSSIGAAHNFNQTVDRAPRDASWIRNR